MSEAAPSRLDQLLNVKRACSTSVMDEGLLMAVNNEIQAILFPDPKCEKCGK